MARRQQAADRAIRPKLRSPGHPRFQRHIKEPFFSLLQKNLLDRQPWRTREQLRIRIVTWIERTYHRRRRRAALGRLTPIEYEAIMTPTATQAT